MLSARLAMAPQPRKGLPLRFGLFPFRSPLLAQSRLISLPPGTEMFQFPGLALPCRSDGISIPPGFPIRTFRAQRLRAAPPDLSQLATSFFACPRLGILRAPLPRLTRCSGADRGSRIVVGLRFPSSVLHLPTLSIFSADKHHASTN